MDVTLELIDHASGQLLAESEAPLESLPERFEGMDTTLTVGGAEYRVVLAEPATRAEVAKAKRVQLVLRKVERVDPKSVLFSLPTLEDALPKVVAGDGASIRVAEDDWRQVEFVHASHRAEVEAELADIARIKTEHRQGHGFDATHVRKRVPAPLAGATVRLAEVEAALGNRARPWGFRSGGVVEDGHAVPDADAVALAVSHGGALTALCVFGIAPDVIGKLHPVALAHDLLLVDWCAGQCLRAHELGFVA